MKHSPFWGSLSCFSQCAMVHHPAGESISTDDTWLWYQAFKIAKYNASNKGRKLRYQKVSFIGTHCTLYCTVQIQTKPVSLSYPSFASSMLSSQAICPFCSSCRLTVAQKLKMFGRHTPAKQMLPVAIEQWMLILKNCLFLLPEVKWSQICEVCYSVTLTQQVSNESVVHRD